MFTFLTLDYVDHVDLARKSLNLATARDWLFKQVRNWQV